MQHLFNSARSRLEDTEGNHLVQAQFESFWLHHGVQIRHVVFMTLVVHLRHILLLLIGAAWLTAYILHVVAIIIRKCTAQIHHLLLARIL